MNGGLHGSGKAAHEPKDHEAPRSAPGDETMADAATATTEQDERAEVSTTVLEGCGDVEKGEEGEFPGGKGRGEDDTDSPVVWFRLFLLADACIFLYHEPCIFTNAAKLALCAERLLMSEHNSKYWRVLQVSDSEGGRGQTDRECFTRRASARRSQGQPWHATLLICFLCQACWGVERYSIASPRMHGQIDRHAGAASGRRSTSEDYSEGDTGNTSNADEAALRRSELLDCIKNKSASMHRNV